MKSDMRGEEEAGKIFVGGLSYETNEEKLKAYFNRYGEVIDCVIMKYNETGKSRGFGFVTFKDPACVSLVLSNGPHQLDNRTIDPKSCTPKGAQRPKKDRGSSKIFLGGLPATVTEDELRNFFQRYGKVQEINIMYDQEKKKPRGFGFLSFETEEATEQVCTEHYVNINGKKVECKRAEPKENSRSARAARTSGPYGGGPPQQQQDQWGPNWNNWNQQGGGGGYQSSNQSASYPGWDSNNYGYGPSQYGGNQQPAPPQQQSSYQGYTNYPAYGGYPPAVNNNGSSGGGYGESQQAPGSNYAQKGSSYGPTPSYGQQEASRPAQGGNQGYHPYRRPN